MNNTKTKSKTLNPTKRRNHASRSPEPGETILTPRQIEIMHFIRNYRTRNGCSPTLREIADRSGVSRVTVFGHIEALIEKGMLLREPNKVRSLILSEQADEYCQYLSDQSENLDLDSQSGDCITLASEDAQMVAGQYPMAGYIAAGRPLDALEMPDTLDLTEMFETRSGTYALKVRGESMIDAHICDGDYVLIEKTNHFRDGQIVVALLEDGQATLKRLYRKNGGYMLEAANPEFQPMFVDNLQVQGIVVGVVRSL